jgi:arylformamidase
VARPHPLLAAALLLVAACANRASSSDPVTPRSDAARDTTCVERADQVDVPYVEDGDPLQRLDLYPPPDAGCASVPLVVWVHGGGWRTGDKGNGVAAKVELWTSAGWAVASVNYRLTDPADPVGQRVVAPAHNDDVAAALGWLAAEAAELGIDPDRIAMLGHSAGAGIVAAVAADPGYLGAHDLDPAAIACAAPLDTEAFDIARVMEGAGDEAQPQLYRLVFGEDPARWSELSPLTHLGDGAVPNLFLVTRGTPERRAQVAAFATAADEAGGNVTVVDLPGFSHEDVNQRIGDPTDDLLTPALDAFLTDCLAPSG